MRITIDRARSSSRRTSLVAAICGSMLIACSDTTDPNVGRAITELKGPTAAVSVGQGFSTKSIVSIRRSSSFTGAVTLTAVGLPQGLLVSFAPATLDGVSELSEMTISALSTLAPGAHSFTLRASGDGVEAKTLNVQVNVTLPAITLAVQTTTANVAQGSTQAIPLTITREGGFTGIVGLAVLGLPAGVTATFSPAALQPGETASTITFSAPLSVQPIARTVTLRATAQGLADKTVPIELNVVPTTTPAVLISAAPPFLQVDGGQFVETTLTLQRFAGFDGAVTVAVEGLPATLTATVTPFATGSNTTTLRINASQQATTATYQIMVRASGAGIEEASSGLAVQTRIMPQFGLVFFDPSAPPLEAFRTSQPVTINRGAAATLPQLEINRVSQFDLPIALSRTGVPSGVTTNLPSSLPGTTTSQDVIITINVSADAIPGVYTMTVQGQAGPIVRQVTIVLTVN